MDRKQFRHEGFSPQLRRFERLLGIDRAGRTTWVWAMPLAVGLLCGIIAPFMPGIPSYFGALGAAVLGIFGFVTMTIISSLYLIAFDRDHNQGDDLDHSTWSGQKR